MFQNMLGGFLPPQEAYAPIYQIQGPLVAANAGIELMPIQALPNPAVAPAAVAPAAVAQAAAQGGRWERDFMSGKWRWVVGTGAIGYALGTAYDYFETARREQEQKVVPTNWDYVQSVLSLGATGEAGRQVVQAIMNTKGFAATAAAAAAFIPSAGTVVPATVALATAGIIANEAQSPPAAPPRMQVYPLEGAVQSVRDAGATAAIGAVQSVRDAGATAAIVSVAAIDHAAGLMPQNTATLPTPAEPPTVYPSIYHVLPPDSDIRVGNYNGTAVDLQLRGRVDPVYGPEPEPVTITSRINDFGAGVARVAGMLPGAPQKFAPDFGTISIPVPDLRIPTWSKTSSAPREQLKPAVQRRMYKSRTRDDTIAYETRAPSLPYGGDVTRLDARPPPDPYDPGDDGYDAACEYACLGTRVIGALSLTRTAGLI